MRVLLIAVLLSGCTVLDSVGESGTSERTLNRIFLGSSSVTVSARREADRYTCGNGPVFCESFGPRMYCSCRGTMFSRY